MSKEINIETDAECFDGIAMNNCTTFVFGEFIFIAKISIMITILTSIILGALYCFGLFMDNYVWDIMHDVPFILLGIWWLVVIFSIILLLSIPIFLFYEIDYKSYTNKSTYGLVYYFASRIVISTIAVILCYYIFEIHYYITLATISYFHPDPFSQKVKFGKGYVNLTDVEVYVISNVILLAAITVIIIIGIITVNCCQHRWLLYAKRKKLGPYKPKKD